MSDENAEQQVAEKPFHVDRAKAGRASCRKCKQKINQGELRLAKLGYNPFAYGTIKQWYHVPCMFEVFKKQRATTKKIEHPDEIEGWENLSETDKQEITSYFSAELKSVFDAHSNSAKTVTDESSSAKKSKNHDFQSHKDNYFRMFRKLCADVANDSSYLTKTKIISDFFEKGSDGDSFKSDVELWCRLLLPGTIIRVYNLQSKQLIKLFSRILETDQEEMLEDLEKGDVAETISKFFKKSKVIKEAAKSELTVQEVDEFLEELSKMTKENEQSYHFKKITEKCTANDLKMILRLVKHDLRINAGPKHVLEALHSDAYKAFQTSRDLKSVVSNALKARKKSKNVNEKLKSKEGMEIDINMMTPVLPMLAQPCKSVQMALEKCPNGMFSEIKYDGERVQLHKKGNTFKYFSRSLKPVVAHKVNHFKDYIPQAFPFGKDLILDAEILMVDTNTGKPLPFGTLGIHKKTEFKNANVCLFVFDCLFYNGKSLLKTNLEERKSILSKNMVEVQNRIMFSEMQVIRGGEELEKMMTNVFKRGLEGLVLKDRLSTYEPGKRHWLKVKKDYLCDGAMADSADLVVLGAWFGTGSKGGLMSSFLMGCHDPSTKKWMTVTKVSNGHDDETLERIQHELDVVKISKDPSRVPDWLKCNKTMIPDFVAADPKKMPVWEITGAEFTRNQVHTADGISIRFPRVTKIRRDKNWSNATDLNELKGLYESSKNTVDFCLDRSQSSSSVERKSAEGKREKEKENDDSGDEEEKRIGEKVAGGGKGVERERENVRKRKRDSEIGVKANGSENKKAKGEGGEEGRKEFRKGFDVTESDFPNPLPDIFTGCFIQMPKEYKDYNFLKRYLIAYGADVCDSSTENGRQEITHVVHLEKSANLKRANPIWSKAVRHVHVDWIWNSIKLLERQRESGYFVTVNEVDLE